MSKSVKKEILASEYSSEQVLAVNTSTMYVGIRPSKSVIKHAPMVVNAGPPELEDVRTGPQHILAD